MSVDLYRPCQCGSGKKIKFCCSREIAADLERVERMAEGGQYLAALERVQGLRKSHPTIPALVALEAELRTQLQQLDEAIGVAQQFVDMEPNNHMGHSMLAFLRCVRISEQLRKVSEGTADPETLPSAESIEQTADEVLDGIQRSFGAIDTELSIRAHVNISSSAFVLAQLGRVPTALALLSFLGMLEEEFPSDQQRFAGPHLAAILQDPQVRLTFKGLTMLRQPPANVSWLREFQQALGGGKLVKWEKTLHTLQDMSRRILDEPVILWNIATLLTWLARYDDAIAAWQNLAQLRQASAWDRWDAAALALDLQELSSHRDADWPAANFGVAEQRTWQLSDAGTAMERALSSPDLVALPPDYLRAKEGPPPRGWFLIGSKAWPTEGDLDHVSAEDAPIQVGDVAVYGKETDREARVVINVAGENYVESALAKIRAILGDVIQEELASSQIPISRSREELAFQVSVIPNRRLSNLRRVTLEKELACQHIYERWADFPFRELKGKTPREAAADAKLRVFVEALLLNFEASYEADLSTLDCNRIRTDMGLAIPEKISALDYSNAELRARITPLRLRWIDFSGLTRDLLVDAFMRSFGFGAHAAARQAGREFLNRPDDQDAQTRSLAQQICAGLANLGGVSPESLEYVVKGRELAIAAGSSPARWLVREFAMRLQLGQPAEASRIMQQLQARYMKEPGIAEQLGTVLIQLGLMTPDGQPVQTGGRQPAPPEAAPPGQLWTPDAPSAAPPAASSSAQAPSRLWVPD